MKMKTWLITLPFLCLAGGAMAQDAAPDAASAPADAAASPARAEAADAVPVKAAKPKMRQRQGGDIRRCLDKKDNEAIIRCTEQGRKPVHKHARKHAPAPEAKPETRSAPAPDSKPAPKP